MIEFACPHCGKQIRTQEESAGRAAKCPACQGELTVPVAAEAPAAGVEMSMEPEPQTAPAAEGAGGDGVAAPPAAGPPGGAARAPVPPPPPMPPEAPATTSGLAVAALVLGIAGIVTCIPILGIIGLILGIVALTQIGNPMNRVGGKGMAITGIVLGTLSIFTSILMAIAILLPALGAARRTARQMQNSTQIRGVQQAMVTFAQNNQEEYPGLDGFGKLVADGPDTLYSGGGGTVEARFALMLSQAFFTGDYATSSAETGKIDWISGPVTSQNYSFSLLQITDSDDGAGGAPTGSHAGRIEEWQDTINTEAIVVSDRAKGPDIQNVYSVHVKKPYGGSDWRGSVAHNDNSVSFESSHVVWNTRYGSGPLNSQDDLFAEDGPPATGANALMVHEGPATVFSGD